MPVGASEFTANSSTGCRLLILNPVLPFQGFFQKHQMANSNR